MEPWRFLVVIAAGLVIATAALVLAAILDAPWLRFVGLVGLAITVLSHEAWRWRGTGRREWLTTLAALVGVMLVAFVMQKLAG